MLESPLNTYIRAMKDFIEEVCKKDWTSKEEYVEIWIFILFDTYD